MSALRVDIWSDIACPWCYIGKRHLEAAVKQFAHDVDITWHSYELDPGAPPVRKDGLSHAERLAAKYHTSVAGAEAMTKRVEGVAQKAGLDMRFDRLQSGNTFDGHRVLHLAKEHGKQTEVKERLFRGYFMEGMQIGDRDVLVRLAAEAGLPEGEVREMLASERFAAEVRKDEGMARELGITGVPFFVIGEQLGVAGAQPPEVLKAALERGWTDAAAGAVCSPDHPEGC